MTNELLLADIDKRIQKAWIAVQLFCDMRDPHGVMDMGAELQALERAKKELEKLK